MPGYIEGQEFLVNFVQIQISHDELFAVIYGFDNIARVGPDDRAASTLQPTPRTLPETPLKVSDSRLS